MSQQTDNLHTWLAATASQDSYTSEDLLEGKRLRAEMQKALAISRIADALEAYNEIAKMRK